MMQMLFMTMVLVRMLNHGMIVTAYVSIQTTIASVTLMKSVVWMQLLVIMIQLL